MQEGRDDESVRYVDVKSLLLFDGIGRVDSRPGAFHQQLVVTFFMNGVVALLALVSLHSKTPQKLVAEGAKGRLAEKFGDELVALERVDLDGRKVRLRVNEQRLRRQRIPTTQVKVWKKTGADRRLPKSHAGKQVKF